jgi:hypothetical protein
MGLMQIKKQQSKDKKRAKRGDEALAKLGDLYDLRKMMKEKGFKLNDEKNDKK